MLSESAFREPPAIRGHDAGGWISELASGLDPELWGWVSPRRSQHEMSGPQCFRKPSMVVHGRGNPSLVRVISLQFQAHVEEF